MVVCEDVLATSVGVVSHSTLAVSWGKESLLRLSEKLESCMETLHCSLNHGADDCLCCSSSGRASARVNEGAVARSQWQMADLACKLRDVNDSLMLHIYSDNGDDASCNYVQETLVPTLISLRTHILDALGATHRRPQHWRGSRSVWIMKPVGLACGESIAVVQGLHEVLLGLRRLEYKCVVQKYIERPLLLRRGQKFDIRQWVLVSRENPLEIYGFSEGYARLSTRPFSLDTLGDSTVHLCNFAVQRYLATGAGSGGGISEGGREEECEAMMRQEELAGHLQRLYGHLYPPVSAEDRARGVQDCVFRRFLLPQMRTAAVNSLLCSRDRISRVGKGFEWLGLDFIVGLNTPEDVGPGGDIGTGATNANSYRADEPPLEVLLLEVNVSPDISTSSPVTERLVAPAVKHLFDIILEEKVSDEEITRGVVGDQAGVSVVAEPRWELWYPHSDPSLFCSDAELASPIEGLGRRSASNDEEFGSSKAAVAALNTSCRLVDQQNSKIIPGVTGNGNGISNSGGYQAYLNRVGASAAPDMSMCGEIMPSAAAAATPLALPVNTLVEKLLLLSGKDTGGDTLPLVSGSEMPSSPRIIIPLVTDNEPTIPVLTQPCTPVPPTPPIPPTPEIESDEDEI